MRLAVAWLAALVAACPPAAAPRPTTDAPAGASAPARSLRFRVLVHENMHATFNYSADDWEETTVTLTLAADGAAEVTDEGKRGESHVDEWGYTAKETRWRNRWRGRWSEGGAATTVELELVERAGEVASEELGKKETAALPAATARLRLDCARVTAAEREALSCAGEADTLGTRLPWVFALDGCLVRLGGRWSGEELRVCAEPATR